MKQKIRPCIWFDDQAEEAAAFYASVFNEAKAIDTSLYSEAGREIHGHEPGSVMSVGFEIDGYEFHSINGGSYFKPNPSISFFIMCESAAEVDAVFAPLAEGGEVLMPLDSYEFSARYGWVQDRFGVSWQPFLATEKPKQRIVPCSLFSEKRCGRTREAIAHYTSVFPDSGTIRIEPFRPGEAPGCEDGVKYGEYRLAGGVFVAMETPIPQPFDFSEGVSFFVECEDQAEVDRYWSALSAVPEAEQCGWLKDRFGVSWQIVPAALGELLAAPQPERRNRVMEAMLRMKKLDIEGLRRAAEEE